MALCVLHAARWSVAAAHHSPLRVHLTCAVAGIGASAAEAAHEHVPGGRGRSKLMAEINTVAKKTNGLLVDAKEAAVVKFWKARSYDPHEPEVTKLKLGYALDQEEALGYLVVRAVGLKPLSAVQQLPPRHRQVCEQHATRIR